MKRIRVFISIDDLRARRAIEYLVRKIDQSNRIKLTVKSLRPCSSKMTRILRAASVNYDHVIVLTDSETRDPEIVVKQVLEKHRLSNNNVKVISVKPCIEAWPCSLLKLKNCNRPPCSEGPISALNNYMRTRHSRDYEKKYLYDVFREVFRDCNCKELVNDNNVPGSLRSFIEYITNVVLKEK